MEIEPTIEQRDVYTGNYGLVIIPDERTKTQAVEMANRLSPNAEYKVSEPHITLYFGQIKALPIEEVKNILENIKKIKNLTLVLNTLQIYGEKFLFWNVQQNDQIQRAHENALSLANYTNPDMTPSAIKEGLVLTPEEEDNIKNFGQPRVKSLYLPHITLAYNRTGLLLPMKEHKWSMMAEDVVFAEMGDLGKVKKIIPLE